VDILVDKVYSPLDWEYVTSSGSFRIIWSFVRTSETVLTVTATKDQQYSGMGMGTVTLWDNDHWASNESPLNTYGAHFLDLWTNEGETAGEGGRVHFVGTLTVAEGSTTSVTITIN
jgi:hypothetical protein